MVERYRNHLIFVKADQDLETALWKTATHIQFNEDTRTFRDVWLPRPSVGFKTKKNAERQMMREAKKWVDERLRNGSQETARTGSSDSNLEVNEQVPPDGSQEKEQTRHPSSPREHQEI
jgi:hypothetical protein